MSDDPPSPPDASTLPIAPLLEKAFRTGPVMEANRLIEEVRQGLRRAYGIAHNYEVSLLDRPPESLWQTVLPQLRRYLRAKGYAPERAKSVFVSLFYGETLYFIQAKDFVEETQRMALSWWSSQSDLDSLPDDVPLLPVPVRKRREPDNEAEGSDRDGTAD